MALWKKIALSALVLLLERTERNARVLGTWLWGGLSAPPYPPLA